MLHNETRYFPADRKQNLIEERISESAIVTFNRPRYLNSLSADMIYSLHLNLLSYEQQRDVNLIILQGQGRKAFAAGGNLVDIYIAIKQHVIPQGFRRDVDDLYRILYELYTMKTPTITIMDGITIGFGAGISLCSKFRIATENTVMMMPETTIGHFTDSSTSYFLSRFKENYGRYLALCAAPIKAHDIMDAGIATHYVPSDKISFMIEHLTQLKSPTIQNIDATIRQYTTEKWPMNNVSSTMDVSRGRMQAIINDCFKYNTVEEIIFALEHEGSDFSLKAKKSILEASPTALKITLELLCRASSLSLVECIVLERRLWNLDMLSHDFQEGCKARLNKQVSQWYPRRLEDVNLEIDVCNNRFEAACSLKPIYLRHIERSKNDDTHSINSEQPIICKSSL